jgi:BMFP domain-containing protein YqiC
MSKTNFLKNLASQLTEALPAHVGTLKKDFEKNCQNILSSAFAKLDLVTREEFDIQTKVLARTRKKLEELEEQIKTLEASLKKKHPHA